MKRRILGFSLLAFAAVARAQGPGAWVEEVLDPTTDQLRRAELLERIAQAGELDGLAPGLAPEGDPEVVHGIVSTLFKHGAYEDHLDRICALVLQDAHRSKMLARIDDLGQHPEKGGPLLAGLVAIGSGKTAAASSNADLRRAAVIALGVVPQRAALEAIVEIGLNDAEESVRAECRVLVRKYLGAATLEAARRLLATNRHRSYFDLLRAHIEAQEREITRLREVERRQLERATAAEALDALRNGDLDSRRNASARLRALAETGPGEQMSPTEFAKQVFDGFRLVRASDVRDAATVTNLVEGLQKLAGEALWRAIPKRETVLEELRPLARDAGFGANDKERRQVGFACVRLLDEIGEPAQNALVEFAESYPHTEVRAVAIQTLGSFARRFQSSGDHVGRSLARLLERGEEDPTVRRQILSTLILKQVPVGKAYETIRAYLVPPDPEAAPELTESEVNDCVAILAQVGTEQAFTTLLDVSREHARFDVRRAAIETGLLPWAARNGREPAILEHLKELALSADQPDGVRLGVIEALGRRGTRNAHATLTEIAGTDGLDAVYRAAVSSAKLELAARMVATKAAEDLRSAVAILDEELAGAEGEQLKRLEKLARDVVKGGDERNLPVGVARYRLAQILRKRFPDRRADVLALFEDAATRAGTDQLPDPVLAVLLKEYCPLLTEDENDKAAYTRAFKWCTRLAELTASDKAEQARHLAQAAKCALVLRKREEGLQLVRRAEEAPLDEAQRERLARLKAELEKLPAG